MSRKMAKPIFSPSSDDSCCTGEEVEESPLRPIFCLKRKVADMKEMDDKYDCFILDFDDPLHTLNSKITQLGDVDEICFVAEKGQVANRDYPHSRHLCLTYPFGKTSNEQYCKMCYCYVCDTTAPCADWTRMYHCGADEKSIHWKNLRAYKKRNLGRAT